MKKWRRVLFAIALAVTVTLVPGQDCISDNADCELFCDSDD